MAEILKVERQSADLLLIQLYDGARHYPRQLWAKTVSRQHAKCTVSGEAIAPGDEVYRPVGNAQNRSTRILARHADAKV